MTLALLFPGQGSQSVGMGVALADAFASAREVYAEIDEALGQKLSVLMREGPEDQLTLTENAQPALMAVSLAAADLNAPSITTKSACLSAVLACSELWQSSSGSIPSST